MFWDIVLAGIVLYVLYEAVQLLTAAVIAWSDEPLYLLVTALLLLLALVVVYQAVWNRPRPYLLTRSNAAKAIESTAQFQHRTKLYFDIDEAEGVIPGACHNFTFSPEKMRVWDEYRRSGALKFHAWGNQSGSEFWRPKPRISGTCLWDQIIFSRTPSQNASLTR